MGKAIGETAVDGGGSSSGSSSRRGRGGGSRGGGGNTAGDGGADGGAASEGVGDTRELLLLALISNALLRELGVGLALLLSGDQLLV